MKRRREEEETGGGRGTSGKFEYPPLLILTPCLIILAILELLQMRVGHFSEDVDAGTASKLSFSSCPFFCCF